MNPGTPKSHAQREGFAEEEKRYRAQHRERKHQEEGISRGRNLRQEQNQPQESDGRSTEL
jgi:hypothetical protein